MTLRKGLAFGFVLLAASLAINLIGGKSIGLGREQVANADVATNQNTPIAPVAKSQRDEIRVVGFGHVDIEEGTTPLSVPAVGPVAEVLVRDGEEVKRGQPLVRLESEAAVAQLARSQAAITEAEVHLSQAQRAPENHRILMDRQRQAIVACKARLEGHRRQVDQLEKLNQSNAVSSANYLSAKDKLLELEASLKADELNLAQLELDKPQDGITLAEAALEAAKAQRIMAQDELDRRTLKAPEDGVALRVLVNKGQMLGPSSQTPAVWFCPNRPRIVRCEIDQEFADQVAVGMTAQLFDDRQKGAHWTGKVTRSADWIAPRRSMLDEPFQKNDVRTLECIVAIDPQSTSQGTEIFQAPRIGQRLRVQLLQDKANDSTLASPTSALSKVGK